MKLHYVNKLSPLHLLNPLSKMTWVASLFILTLVLDHPLVLLALFLFTLLPVLYSGTLRGWASIMRYSLLLCLSVIIINTLFNVNGSHVLWQSPWHVPVLGNPRLTLEALVFGLGMSLRLLALISAFTLLTLTTHPDDMLQALLKLKMPYKTVLVAALSTRFIPTLLDDAGRISDIQRSRGLETQRGNYFRRIKNHSAVLLPLLANSLDRTVQVAEAMEARGFGSGRKRCFFKPLKMSGLDALSIVFSLLALVPAAFLKWRGTGAYQYYPSLGEINIGPGEWTAIGLMLLLLSLLIPLGQLKKRWTLD
jgi:energy-coupling factor transport system permease protein